MPLSLFNIWVLLTTGCVKHISVDGLSVSERWYQTYSDVVRKRAASDFGCDEEEIALVLLTVSEGYPQSFGAEGCGRKAVYLRPMYTTNWVLNSN